MADYIHRRHFCSLMLGTVTAGFCANCLAQALSPHQEKQLGMQEHPKIIAENGGVYDDPKVGGYFALIASRLVRATGRPDIGFRFTLLNSAQVNAFALPGGFVYITRGLVALANNEAEIAGVIGHEIGHVVARHISKRIEHLQRAEREAQAAGLLGAIMGAPGVGQAALGAAQRRLAGFSQEQEHEADVLGVRYIAQAGYNPDGLASFLGNLRAHSQLRAVMAERPTGSVDSHDMLSSHPRTVDRVRRSIQLAKIARGGWQENYRKAFLRNINGMVFGDDPAQGIVQGQVFSHKGLRLTFRVPKGFHLENRQSEVVAAGPQGGSIKFDMASKLFHGTMRSYLVNVWAKKAQVRDVEAIRINGMDAATGWIQARLKRGNMTLRLVAIRYDRKHICRFLFLVPGRSMGQLSRGLRHTTYSFRRLTASEAGTLRPLHIRVVKLEAIHSITTLARRMAVSSHKEHWFRVLNNAQQQRTIPAGSEVKLVV